MKSLIGNLLNKSWYGLAMGCYEARKKKIKNSIYVDLEHLPRDIAKKKMQIVNSLCIIKGCLYEVAGQGSCSHCTDAKGDTKGRVMWSPGQ